MRSALTRRFGASVAEVDDQDLWQRATLAAGLVSAHRPASSSTSPTGSSGSCWRRFPEGVRVERRLVSFEDLDA